MLKVAIVGCGRIADSHAEQIRRIAGCEIVGACDKEELMAKQLCERFHVKRYFSDVTTLLRQVHPDVVHITTPPQSHLEVGTECLEGGCHVLVEKPFTLNAAQAQKLIALAEKKGARLTVGHDAQFSDVAMRMRTLVRSGYLGGPPVHMESFWCYDFGDLTYAKTLLADRQHWARMLPGGLLHNVISHGIARIAEFLRSDTPRIISHGFVSQFLQDLGEKELVDELRVLISEDDGLTGYFTFSSQMRPSLHQFWIYGPKNGLFIDEDQRIMIKLPGNRLKSYAEHFIPPLKFAGQYVANWVENARRFLAMDFHMDAGKKRLIEGFYRSIVQGTPVPIPYREILLTSRIMDTIFEQIRENKNGGSWGIGDRAVVAG